MNKKRNLYIIGASHLGRELESWLELIPIEKRDWELKGFLHSYTTKSPLEGYPIDYSILGGWESYTLNKDDYCIISVSDVNWREQIYNSLKDKVTFLTYIAPNVIIGKYSNIGNGSLIFPGCIISTNVTINENVFINSGTQIGHDSIIEKHSSLMAGITIGGNCKIGKKVFVGSNSTIIPKIILNDESIVGAGSVVIRKVKSKTTVFGNPATLLKE